ncbi:MAG: rod shape-determining protein MreD [Anaerolineae bacterium]|nr:rod shape-determining protein MreD [Anaerolineae bacterium]
MRRIAIPIVLIVALSLIEASLLPPIFNSPIRPNLIVMVMAVWIAFRGTEGFVWSFLCGLLLDLLSSTPFGTITIGIMLGNLVAEALDQSPIVPDLVRVFVRTAIVTLSLHTSIIATMSVKNISINFSEAITGILLPTIALNFVSALLVYVIFRLVERFTTQQRRRVY